MAYLLYLHMNIYVCKCSEDGGTVLFSEFDLLLDFFQKVEDFLLVVGSGSHLHSDRDAFRSLDGSPHRFGVDVVVIVLVVGLAVLDQGDGDAANRILHHVPYRQVGVADL